MQIVAHSQKCARGLRGWYKPGTQMTLQMRGAVRIADKEKFTSELEQYYAKRGNHHDDIVDPVNVLLEFTPNWACYKDYTKGYERRMLRLGDKDE